MKNVLEDGPYAGSYVVPADYYDQLCEVRDKVMLMAQLAGTASSLRDDTAILHIRRSLVGQMFADLGFQLNDVLESIAHVTQISGLVQANSVN
ncbi:hypothetical protein [Dyella sp. 2HG41-7]|uniref:XAC0095 family protein n=1 Tax=Dyella sp. 2HG41-7 TaxID=2883239 RepID=UPI001F29C723|nr:hypothetical protein [Dyella sp. 2HG41-7]